MIVLIMMLAAIARGAHHPLPCVNMRSASAASAPRFTRQHKRRLLWTTRPLQRSAELLSLLALAIVLV